MAEASLFYVAARVVKQLGAEAVTEIGRLGGVENDLNELRQTLSAIKAVLRDAEKRQVSEERVKIWLERLEDVVYDADNLFDKVSYEALRKRVNNKVSSRGLAFLKVGFRFKVAQRIKAIRRTLKEINDDKDQFNFQLNCHEEENELLRDRETYSHVVEENVIGRDLEKMEILQLLVGSKSMELNEVELSVIPIVGVGGIGKTTLAQLVYNDASVQQHFDLKIWVCVSEDFRVRSLTVKIIQSAAPGKSLAADLSLQGLQRTLREEILHGKKYLLVLDDVWNEDSTKWKALEDLLRNGKMGNKIIITARSENVARVSAGTMKPCRLKNLNEEESWNLFKTMAFVRGEELNDPIKVGIGKEIAKKCYGVPLVIRSIGSLLVSSPEIEWSSFNDELSKHRSDNKHLDDVLQMLKLSYDHLSPDVKHCFAYCSLFPKDYDIDKVMLTDHWVAQGFISIPSSSQQSTEQLASQYFEGLVARGFLEYYQRHGQYKMHDIIHDLAVWVAGNKCVTLTHEGNSDDVHERTRHVSLLGFDHLSPTSSTWTIPSSLVKANMIESILIPTESNFLMINRKFPPPFYEALVSKFKYLRSLDLHNSGIDTVPDSIRKLKHLRTLDLSRNTELKTLPNSVSKLLNLQVLNLSSCFNFEELPSGALKLVNLRNLRLDYCHHLTHLPRGLGQLTNLRTLSRLVLSKDGKSAEISDLKNLNNLRGRLEIRNLEHGMDIEVANFKEKRHLKSLSLFWSPCSGELEVVDHERTFRGIQPIPSLEDLLLNGYKGVGLPSWLTLKNLVKLRLERMPNLEYITSSWDSSTTIMPFLNRLDLRRLPNLRGWWKDIKVNGTEADSFLREPQMIVLPFFPRLGSLYVYHCPQLRCMPLFPTVGWELELTSSSWKPFLQTLEHVTRAESPTINEAPSSSSGSSLTFNPIFKLMRLFLYNNKDLEQFPDYLRNLTSCQFLWISEFQKLKSLSPGIHHFVSLRELRIGYCIELDLYDENVWRSFKRLTDLTLRGLPQMVDVPEGLHHVTTLVSVCIGFCHNLTSVPEWLCNLKSPLEVMECPELKSLPEGTHAEITSHNDENIYLFPHLMQRFGLSEDQDGYRCAPIPLLRLHQKSSKVGDHSKSSSPGLEWELRGPFWFPKLITN